MFSYRTLALGWVLGIQILFAQNLQAQTTQGVGRAATAAEIKAWDIDVRPDFKGLPKGSGSVSLGEQVWEGKCASCHGTFGESNSVFFQLVGYTTKADIAKGNVGALQLGRDAPARTMSMKLASLSTLWDYINRAMPWTAPKSLSVQEVYGVTAYLLYLSDIVPEKFVLSDDNMSAVQAMLPNRNGMTLSHAMWPGKELNGIDGLKAKPDTQGTACMRDCAKAVSISSFIPAYAMTAHGNLAEQNRTWNSIVGLDTRQVVAGEAMVEVVSEKAVPRDGKVATSAVHLKAKEVMPLLQKNGCTACHAMSSKLVGPSFKEVAKKYTARGDAAAYLAGKIKSGGSGVWGAIAMPPSQASDADIQTIAQWLSLGAH